MDFSERAKKVFYEELGLNNRQISKRMDNYNETLVSRYMNDKMPSATFVKKIKKFFPELNYIDWFQYESIGNEKSIDLKSNALNKIDKIIKELLEIKEVLSQN
jgi:hypothetical protein